MFLYSNQFTRNTGIDHANAKKSFDFIISCVFLNKNHAWNTRTWDIINNSATTIRFSRALDPKKQPVICTGGNGTRWRYIKDPGLETRLWMWQIASVGGGIWNCYFNGPNPARTHDRRNACSEKDVFAYLAKNSAVISDTVPSADVGIYYSNITRDRLLKTDELLDDYGVYFRGIERVLLENHIQYRFIPDSELSPERLKGLKALLLPNTAYLSDHELEIIKNYIKDGGGMICSHKVSFFDEKGNPRQDFGLAEVLGIHFTGLNIDTANDTYQLIRDKESPVFKNIGDTDVIINGGSTILVTRTNADYHIAATHIPTIHNQPPEYAWLPDMKTDYPTIVTGTYGKGKVVYFANTIESLCFTNGHEDYTEIYRNAIGFVSNENFMVKVNAPRSVHVNIIEAQQDSNHLVVALVNTTGTSQRPMKEVVPVSAMVRIPLRGRTLKDFKILWGDTITVVLDGDSVLITVKTLEEFASIELHL